MSDSIGLATGFLSNAERVDVRRFCGYPAYGPGNSSFQSWRFFQAYGMLEFRLTNMVAEELQVVRLYLSNCYILEAAIPAATANIGTAQAAVWTRNPQELRDRTQLYNAYRRQFCGFFGVPPGPDLGATGAITI